VAGYLSLYQWRVIEDVWEPFFGIGSRTILNSSVSRVLPVPDAALGALSYLVDAITGIVGGTRRWRSLPWIVVIFSIAVGPLGAPSACCSSSSAASLRRMVHALPDVGRRVDFVTGPAMDELLASLQHLARSRAQGQSSWRSAVWPVRR
jgi:hypothetical protein